MSKKKRQGSSHGGLVYSTNRDLNLDTEQEEKVLLPASQQLLMLHRETKGRGGKAVVIVRGFAGSEADLAALGKLLKAHCGTGGSVKDGEIIIQGDQRAKVESYLQSKGYRTKNVGG